MTHSTNSTKKKENEHREQNIDKEYKKYNIEYVVINNIIVWEYEEDSLGEVNQSNKK